MVYHVTMHPTRCAICGTEGNADQIYPATFSETAFNETIFSARRLPDRVHYRLVKCKTCGLVRSDPIVDVATLATLYQRSNFNYDDQVPDLKSTYGRYLTRLEQFNVNKDSLLEIGSGNGFFLEVALEQGYTNVHGVEPSSQAISRAAPHTRPHLICDIMRPNLFEANTFDVICIFQVFDHITDPAALLDECYRILKPGGLLLAYNHNVEAITARMLRESSPIIDIEHTYLYSFKTMAQIVRDHQFAVREVGSAYNRYQLHYLCRLLPFPKRIKSIVLSTLGNSFLGRIRLVVPLGNLYLIAQRN